MGAAAAGTSSLPQPSRCLLAMVCVGAAGGPGTSARVRAGKDLRETELWDPLSLMCGHSPCGLYSVKLGIFLCKKVIY